MAPPTVIKIEDVKFNDEENAKAHHTDMFYANYESLEYSPVLLRRAAPFTWTLTFDDTFDPELTELWTTFQHTSDKSPPVPIQITAPKSSTLNSKSVSPTDSGSKTPETIPSTVIPAIKPTLNEHAYSLTNALNNQIKQSRAAPATSCSKALVANFGLKAKMLNIAISLPADAVPGEYNVQFGVAPDNTAASDVEMKTNVSRKIVILCNPWDMCDDAKTRDVCSLLKLTGPAASKDARLKKFEAELKLYVTNTTANWWENDVKHEWKLKQFDALALNFALTLLNKINLTGDEAKVLPNVIEAIANLLGRLVLEPSESVDVSCLEILKKQWSGSPEIIQSWQSNNEQLEDGQSWMFAGLLTTVLRTLGIGSRLVSATNTGIDLDKSNTIDIKYVRNGGVGKPFKRALAQGQASGATDKQEGTKPIHVWTELFMNARADIDNATTPIYGGWQAIDASSSPMIDAFSNDNTIGPTPVAAILNGDIVDDTKNSKLINGKYWYSLLSADILQYFVQNKNGTENIVAVALQRDNYAENVTTETVSGNYVSTVDDRTNEYIGGAAIKSQVRSSLIDGPRGDAFKVFSHAATDDDIKLSKALTSPIIEELKGGASINIPLTLKNGTQELQQYRMQYILVNATTGEVIVDKMFPDKWAPIDKNTPTPINLSTDATTYLRNLENPWLLDAYAIATFKSNPKLTRAIHHRFTVVPPELTVVDKPNTATTTPTPNTKTYTVSLTNNLPSSMCGCEMTLHVSPSDGVQISRSAGFINSCDFISPNKKMENEFTVEFPKLVEPDSIKYRISASIDCDQLGKIIAVDSVDVEIDALAPSAPSTTTSTANSSENSSDAEDDSDEEDAKEQKKKDDEAYKKRLQDALAKMKCKAKEDGDEDKDNDEDKEDNVDDGDVEEDIIITTKFQNKTTKQQTETTNSVNKTTKPQQETTQPQRFYCADTNIGTICVPASDVVATSPPVPGRDNGNTDVEIVTTQGFNASDNTVIVADSGSGVPFKNASQTQHSANDVYQVGTNVDQRGNGTTTRPTDIPRRAGQQSTAGHGNGSQRHGSSSRRDTPVKRCWLTGFPKRTRGHHD